ncbi:pyocin knob domain-containing protein [Cypionkella sp.]|uniref:pyocin knob domain-containing protein n=1 Tax=Cypionkella sp. TaxID=2811411 RepID=UPI0027218B59|nr:pyocin knob domain-containing protein [Cypionkella sp.]MDO8985348.1 pyocin knob domain-containing protein [Cypionkella sp.]
MASAPPEFNALADYLGNLALATGPGLFLDGTAAAPGVSFASDTDTGLFRSGANLLAFSAGGTRRALLSTTAFQIDVPITGTAVQASATDTTAGRLLKVGAFGLGVIATAPVLTDFDATDTASGTYSYTTGATGTFPSGVTAAAGGVITVYRESAAKGYMTLQPASNNVLYFRNLYTTWGTWQELAKIDSPAFRGTPAVPTAAAGTNTTQIASTAYVKNEIPTALNASGSAPIYACRAWVNFNGTNTVAIRSSGNVSSITDNGVGNYTVNFTTAMDDADFSAVASGQSSNSVDGYCSIISTTTTSVRVGTRLNNSIQDSPITCVAIFR